MPEEVRDRIKEELFGRSGARVTSLTEVERDGPYNDDGGVEGIVKRDSLCAPFLEGER